MSEPPTPEQIERLREAADLAADWESVPRRYFIVPGCICDRCRENRAAITALIADYERVRNELARLEGQTQYEGKPEVLSARIAELEGANARLREFVAAHDEVERGIADFRLNGEAIERLQVARTALQGEAGE